MKISKLFSVYNNTLEPNFKWNKVLIKKSLQNQVMNIEVSMNDFRFSILCKITITRELIMSSAQRHNP